MGSSLTSQTVTAPRFWAALIGILVSCSASHVRYSGPTNNFLPVQARWDAAEAVLIGSFAPGSLKRTRTRLLRHNVPSNLGLDWFSCETSIVPTVIIKGSPVSTLENKVAVSWHAATASCDLPADSTVAKNLGVWWLRRLNSGPYQPLYGLPDSPSTPIGASGVGPQDDRPEVMLFSLLLAPEISKQTSQSALMAMPTIIGEWRSIELAIEATSRNPSLRRDVCEWLGSQFQICDIASCDGREARLKSATLLPEWSGRMDNARVLQRYRRLTIG
jgi:hypothetical protein